MEDEIKCGQVEELIVQAKNELELIPQYASWKLWEETREPVPIEFEGHMQLAEHKESARSAQIENLKTGDTPRALA